MDSFGERGALMASVESAIAYNRHIIEAKASDQNSLFGEADSSFSEFQVKESPEASMDEKLAWEKELLGLYISGNPLDKFREKILERRATIKRLQEEAREGAVALIAGIIDESKEILTKKGDKMAFIRLADYTDTVEVVVFPKIFTEFKDLLKPGTCVIVKGKVSKRNEELSVIVDAIRKLE
jgi:DNA polymerase-3 subunit alpha